MESIEELTAPFLLPGAGERASTMILMVHGFTGSPLEFRRLGHYLNRHGYTVHAVRLPGHGTTLKDMTRTRWSDWWAHIVSSYEDVIRFGGKKIVAVGHSMGGLLALKLAVEKKVDGAVCLSTPIYIQKRLACVEVMKQWLGNSSKSAPAAPAAAESFYYAKPPLQCLISLWFLLSHVKRSLAQVRTPLLITQGSRDEVVHPRSADYIYGNTSSPFKAIKYYPNSTHAILTDHDRDQLYSDIYHFVNRIIG
ncbi:hypothetical protein SD70_17505 [Gordoniibacillus kamchatkensis]|uniref:Serine aminopeptidase S33 domain-containing protein n=1 Tax=Gordoniibacillus kamchatkensis TaxID=1590651 RepID=A0ABR5AFR8_9BACL|nr:alpha/beta fold hydrolase [Paenibacillus sp. VKM B-2647]KIL39857.1 hypothetical protein SD70_17505 [Paenibacillus sp. VKM B-2647]